MARGTVFSGKLRFSAFGTLTSSEVAAEDDVRYEIVSLASRNQKGAELTAGSMSWIDWCYIGSKFDGNPKALGRYS